jgi:hypothetical protein
MLPFNIIAQAINGLYATVNLSDTNGNNAFELVSDRIDAVVLKELFEPLTWSETTNGTQMATEVPYVDNPDDYKDISVVPFSVFVKVTADQPQSGTPRDDQENVTFVTQDEQGNTKILTSEAPRGSKSHTPFTIAPGSTSQFYVGLPYDLLGEIHGSVTIRTLINVGGSKFQVQSAPIDAQLINDFINAVAGVAPKLTPIPEENLNPLPGAAGANAATTPGSAISPTRRPAAPKPPAKRVPTILAQVESSSYTAAALIAFSVLIVTGFFLRRRK